MKNDDDLVFLNQGEDEENAVFQTQEESNEILNENDIPQDDYSEIDLETTIQMTQRKIPREKRAYWRRVFG